MPKETGSVNDSLEPCIYVEFENGKRVECVIDTGFNGSLCLPQELLAELELQPALEVEIAGVGQHREVVWLAFANIAWLGQMVEIEVLINKGDDRLLGSELLAGATLTINYKKRALSVKVK